MNQQISLSSIRDLVRLGELEKLFNYFGRGLEIFVPLVDGKLYDEEDRKRVKSNITAVREYLGKDYQIDPEISVRDADEDGNIDTVKYGLRITKYGEIKLRR